MNWKESRKKLIKLYKSEGSKLDKQIAQYYTIYGKDNVIEYRALLQRLSTSERDLLIRDIDAFVNKYPQFENVKAVRESIYKLDRLEGLRVSIEMQQMELAGKEKELIGKHLIDTYGKGVMDSLNRLGHGTNFNTFDKNVVRKFINEKWIDGKSLSKRIYDNRSKVAKYIVTQFRNGVIRGDTYRDLSNSLIGKFSEVSSKQAMRLIRTEGTRVMNEATISTFEKEFEEYRYSAIFDDRTSQICKSLDGRVFKMKDRQAGVNFPPMHANCRSSYDIEIPKNWMELAQEKAREYDKGVENHDIKDYNLNKQINFDVAAKKVIEHGIKTGNEGLMWLDLNGNEIIEFVTGDSSRVKITKDTINHLMSLEKDSVISLHNHPGSSSFSSADMNVACRIESVKEMRVIGHDGTKYFLEIGSGIRPSFNDIDEAYHVIGSKLNPKYQKIFDETGDSKGTWKEQAHEINEELARIFNWTYRRELK